MSLHHTNSVPHLVAPVITDVKAATAALKWAVEEMERRYELFAHAGARDLTRYNTIVSERNSGETLPYIVIVIDELADLMMVAPGDVEEAICRIAQKARACGIHLLVATQRPSVDVITGLIKSNIPTRIAFTVSSQVDSRTIIDIGGAEKLLSRGDMLFLGNGTSKPVRVQGVYVSDDEIEKTVDHVKKQMKPNYLFKQEDLLAKTEQAESEDELFLDACQFVVEQGERPHLLYSENSASVIIARHVSLKRWNRKELFLKVEVRSQEMSLFLRMNLPLCRKQMYSKRFCCILRENVG